MDKLVNIKIEEREKGGKAPTRIVFLSLFSMKTVERLFKMVVSKAAGEAGAAGVPSGVR